MLRKTITLLCAASVVAAIAALGGCGDDDTSSSDTPTSGGTLKLAQAADVTGFDQTKTVDNETIRVISQITEPLYRADESGKLVPWLATDYEKSNGDKTWTFTLRDGVKFSNGDPLTADDVVYTLQRTLDSAAWSFILTGVSDVSAPTPSTVEITTEKPSAALLAEIANFVNGIVPKDLAGMTPQQWARSPIGTGPFMLDSWTRGSTVTLKRNTNYWDEDRPYLDQVDVNNVTDTNSRVSQLQGGQQDVSASPPLSQVDNLGSSPDINIAESALARVDQLYINVKEDPFTDPKVREAIAQAIDRPAIADGALFGHGEPAKGLLAPSVTPEADLPPLEPDTEAASGAVSGLPQGSREFDMILTSGDVLAKAEAQILQQQLNNVGFDVSLQPVDSATLTQDWQTSNFGALLTYTSSDIVDPSEVAGFYVGNNGLFTNAPTEEVGKRVAQADTTLDEPERASQYDEIQTLINDENALISLVTEPYIYGVRSNVAGFTINPTGIYWLADVGFTG